MKIIDSFSDMNRMAKHRNQSLNLSRIKRNIFVKSVCVFFCCNFFLQCAVNKQVTKSNPVATVEKYNAQAHFSAIYSGADMKYTFKGSSLKDFLKWQNAFRPELKKALGLDILEKQLSGFQPEAKLLSSEDIGFAIRERWTIQTEPTVTLPFILLRPKIADPSRILVITPHGHSKNTELYAGVYHDDKERESGEVGERDVAVQAAKEGYFAIAPTTRGFGETRTQEDIASDALSSCRTLLMHDILVGRTPIGDRVWDISRLIDWAVKKLPVDPEKIVVTGNSGGGTVTLFAAACDTRISLAVPSSYFCTFTGSIGTLHHCDCNYIPGILQLGEMADVAGLIAPRPFCAVQGKLDNIFPIEESRKAYDRLKLIYSAAGASDMCELYEGNEGHRYYKAGVWPFVRKHLILK
jgi:dienelactone hydrolase